MASVIRVLSEQTINQIAAGEVIENPSSVVKELVENSLDAGATEIHVEIQGGGRQLIRVTDNGKGMNADDALLCLERHATSKIKQVDDLDSLMTMGFRGEALPSIASISKFTLTTSTQEEEGKGTRVIVEGGQIIKCGPLVSPVGTTIEVKSLFYNVPVRKKFQRSPTFDTQEILKILTSLSLGHPTISFQLVSSQKTILNALHPQKATFVEQLHERITQVLGSEYLMGMVPMENVREDDQVKGYIGLPAYTRHNRTGQFLFINNRYVQSPLVSFSVKEGYGHALPTNRYPVYVLHLTIPGSIVDVNVHPQKREVRLRQEQLLRGLITKGVEKALQRAGYTQQVETEDRPLDRALARPSFSFPTFVERPAQGFSLSPSSSPLKSSVLSSWTPPSTSTFQPEKIPTFLDDFIQHPPKVSVQILTTLPGYILLDPSFLPDNQNGVCVIDQRAAHSRVIYEKLLESHKKGSSFLEIQSLLLPHTFDVNALEASLLKEHLSHLHTYGIAIKEFGPHTFMIDAIPQLFGNTAIEEFVRDLLSRLQELRNSDLYKSEFEKELATAASQAALSKNRRLSKEEADQLVKSLMRCQIFHQCPKGRSTMITWSLEELSKQFSKKLVS
jgi:DNA mismatch repair protein MutL